MDDTIGCRAIPDWYLRHRVAVLDLRSRQWQAMRSRFLSPGYAPDVCLRRLAAAGRVRRLQQGVYLLVDPIREIPTIAIASALYAETSHYVTTDAALVFHGLIDQPIPTLTVVVAKRARRVSLGDMTIRPVALATGWLEKADAYETRVDGFTIRVASREQALTDALAEPGWMTHGSLLPEVLAVFTQAEVMETAARSLARSTAAAQRLGYLLDEAGVELPASLVAIRPVRTVYLRPRQRSGGAYSTRWRVHG